MYNILSIKVYLMSLNCRLEPPSSIPGTKFSHPDKIAPDVALMVLQHHRSEHHTLRLIPATTAESIAKSGP